MSNQGWRYFRMANNRTTELYAFGTKRKKSVENPSEDDGHKNSKTRRRRRQLVGGKR